MYLLTIASQTPANLFSTPKWSTPVFHSNRTGLDQVAATKRKLLIRHIVLLFFVSLCIRVLIQALDLV